ncbi:TraB/GumN family protein [Sphingobium chungbukense]|uniref:Polysaccharide biosynthesis protein GumN n=1 Tax=Sphingobium chungbukense TaxID=56193 RepID=A0A0M3AV54_9SPHN|nr:TraB/GumN family protein [Sphingobium chungbukense]KKW92781.1 polysaccharide biosynthesis protein GumN [Sphingobium chungbukense]
MKWPSFRWLAPAMMLLGGCALGQPVSARDAAARQTYVTPALWTVKDADTTIYLFGTVHVMKPGIDWYKGEVKSAFERSDELVLEIVEPQDPDALASTMAGVALARDGVKLSDRLGTEERGKYQAAMTANGLPWPAFEMFNPWMAGMALSVQPLAKLGYQSDLGAEKVLTAKAKASGKKVGALETVEQQLGYFAGLPMEQQVKFLTATIEGLPDMDKEFASLLDHWQGGEPEKLAVEMNESLEATPELAKVLLIQRNANWAKWIKQRLDQPGTVFIAVGAGHLAGKGSVQDQLKALGISSERVKQ